MATKGQICAAHNECTHCPIRSACSIRENFYSDAVYEEFMNDTIAVTGRVAKFSGLPESIIQASLKQSRKMMDHRRKVELELYPTYSPV